VDGGLNVRSTPTLQRFRTMAGCHGNLGRNVTLAACGEFARKEFSMNAIIYVVGLIVIVMAILSFIGLR
jgi:hypothetical protein